MNLEEQSKLIQISCDYIEILCEVHKDGLYRLTEKKLP